MLACPRPRRLAILCTVVATNDEKDVFSRAYLFAIAAAAGLMVEFPSRDAESVDAQIRPLSASQFPRSPRLEVQLKCSSDVRLRRPDGIHFELEQKNYDDLRKDAVVPKLLVVVLVPSEFPYLHSFPHLAILKYSAYWKSLYGLPSNGNKRSTTVEIPWVNRLTPEALRTILSDFERGRFP
jgi:hypothetical protein